LHQVNQNTTASPSASTEMAPPTDRKEILAAFRKQIDSGTAIVGAGAGMQDIYRNPGCPKNSCSPFVFPGIGLTAKSAEAGGISLIIIYNRYLAMSHQMLDLP
jgi:predicted TIM-barrel enzyme